MLDLTYFVSAPFLTFLPTEIVIHFSGCFGEHCLRIMIALWTDIDKSVIPSRRKKGKLSNPLRAKQLEFLKR